MDSDAIDMDTEWLDAFQIHVRNVNRLNMTELRVLLIHYKFALDKRDAKTWTKADAVDAIAEQLTTDEIG
jgi:hypothetical protein